MDKGQNASDSEIYSGFTLELIMATFHLIGLKYKG
jgi:hypothetical protein